MNKNLKILLQKLVTVVIILTIAGCSEKKPSKLNIQEAADSPKKLIGLSVAGSDACYDAASSVFIHLAEEAGWEVLYKQSKYSVEQENLNLEEFAARKVDAVLMITTDIENSGRKTAELLEQGIPVFFMMTLPKFPDQVKASAIVTTDWYMTGYLPGEYIARNLKEARCVLIEGGYNQGMTELMREGFLDGIQSTDDNHVTVVANVSGSWMKPNAMAALENLLDSDIEFDTIFTGNEEMMKGVVEVLENRNLLGEFSLFSENGRPDVSGQLIPSGTMIATSDAATTQEGDIIFQLMRDFFDGKPTPYHVYSPVKLLTAENIQLAIPWDPDLYLEQRDQLISSDYHNLKEVTEPRPWSKDLNNYNNILFHK